MALPEDNLRDRESSRSWRHHFADSVRLLLRGPVMVVVAAYFLFDDVVLATLRPILGVLGRLQLFHTMSIWLRRQPPLVALLLFGVPFLVLEPPKVYAVFLIGTGHIRTGALLLTVLQIATVATVERLFHVLQPTLMQIPWFAWIYRLVIHVRDWALLRLKATAAWRIVAEWATHIKSAARSIRDALRR